MNTQLQEVKSMLGQLRLSGAREKLEEILFTATREEFTLLEFTRRLLSQEVEARNAKGSYQINMYRVDKVKHKMYNRVGVIYLDNKMENTVLDWRPAIQPERPRPDLMDSH